MSTLYFTGCDCGRYRGRLWESHQPVAVTQVLLCVCAVDVSARTRGFLKHLAVRGDHPPRVEVLCPTVFDKRPDVIAETLDTLGARDRSQATGLDGLEKVLTALPERVLCCIYALAVYLKDFHLGRYPSTPDKHPLRG
eukprot:m.1278652 g.1278652  ORF g.1278652 m.1278652 type:complete len:138 (-) comp24765_c0_seq7:2653-3066(-)